MLHFHWLAVTSAIYDFGRCPRDVFASRRNLFVGGTADSFRTTSNTTSSRLVAPKTETQRNKVRCSPLKYNNFTSSCNSKVSHHLPRRQPPSKWVLPFALCFMLLSKCTKIPPDFTTGDKSLPFEASPTAKTPCPDFYNSLTFATKRPFGYLWSPEGCRQKSD